MKQILFFLLLIVVTSCCKEDYMDCDLDGSISSISNLSVNAGIYTDHRVNGKHLTLEINPKRGNLQAVEFTVVYVLSNKDSRISTVTLTDRDFDYEFVYTGFTGRTWTTLNYVLDDPTIYIKEISIEGKLKIDEKWYRMDERKTIKNWQWMNCQLFFILNTQIILQFLSLLVLQPLQYFQYIQE